MKKELLIQLLQTQIQNKAIDEELYRKLVSLSKEEESILEYAISLTRKKNLRYLLNLIKEDDTEVENSFFENIKRIRDNKDFLKEKDKTKLFSAAVLKRGSEIWNTVVTGLFYSQDTGYYLPLFTNEDLLDNQELWQRLLNATFGKQISPFLYRLFTNKQVLTHLPETIDLIRIYEKTVTAEGNNPLFDSLADRLTSTSLQENDEIWLTFVHQFITSYETLEANREEKDLFEQHRKDLFDGFILLSEARELLKDEELFNPALDLISLSLTDEGVLSPFTNETDFNYKEILPVLTNPLYYNDKELYKKIYCAITGAIYTSDYYEALTYLRLLDLPMPLSKSEVLPIIELYDFNSFAGYEEESSIKLIGRTDAFYRIAQNDELRLHPEERVEAMKIVLNERDLTKLYFLSDILTDPVLLTKPNLRTSLLKEVEILDSRELNDSFFLITHRALLEDDKRYHKATSIWFRHLKRVRELGPSRVTKPLKETLMSKRLLKQPKDYDYLLRKLDYVLDKRVCEPYLSAATNETLLQNPTIWKMTLEKIMHQETYNQAIKVFSAVIETFEEQTLTDYVLDQTLTPKTLLAYLEKSTDDEITLDTKVSQKAMVKVITNVPSRKKSN